MAFKDIMMRIRRAVLCGAEEERKCSLEISSPTYVGRGVLTMSGLSKEQEALIREKASKEAARSLSLTSHPPTRPSSSPPSPPSSSPNNTQPSSLCSSREPSMALLNSASANLPTSLPTPPRQQHSDSNLPARLPHAHAHPHAHNRMKGFWERTRRLSNSLSTHSVSHGNLYQGLGKSAESDIVLLNLDIKDLELESPVSAKSVKSIDIGGFEVQDVVGGATPDSKRSRKSVIRKELDDVDSSDCSSDEEAEERIAERVALVRA